MKGPVPLIRMSGVEKAFGSGALATSVLKGVDLEIFPGELVLLMGPSGSGKTTLLSIAAGLLRASKGAVELCGNPISDFPEPRVAKVRRQHVGLVFQSYNLFPGLSALENVSEVVAMKGAPLRAARQKAETALAAVGLAHRLGHLPGTLSGGEQQRVAIARALALEPTVIFGDEPTAALDTDTGLSVMRLLRQFVGSNTAVLLVTHDRRLERFGDRVVDMEDGRILSVRTAGKGSA